MHAMQRGVWAVITQFARLTWSVYLQLPVLCPPPRKGFVAFLAFKHGGRDVFVCTSPSLFATTRIACRRSLKAPQTTGWFTARSTTPGAPQPHKFAHRRSTQFPDPCIRRRKIINLGAVRCLTSIELARLRTRTWERRLA